MGPSKKRKGPPLNCTLLDFFPGPDAVKRARVRASQQLGPGRRQTKLASRETIVIDSDNDDGVHEKDRNKSIRLDSRKEIISEDSRSLNSVAPTLTQSEDRDSFGLPSALLRPPNPHLEASNDRFHTQQGPSYSLQPSHSKPMFGVSAPLLEQPSISNQLHGGSQINSVFYENASTAARGNSANDPVFEFPVEEWAAGDDELVALEILNNKTEIDEGEEELSDEQRFCPVCNIDLTGMLDPEAETHVNQCLDTPSSQNDNIISQKSITASTKCDVTSSNSDLNTLIKEQGGDLFTVLMSSHKEKEIWVEADAAADCDFRPTRGNRRKAPFYKVLQGMPIAVDAFCYGTIPGVTAYFLSHAHSDHYTNLGSKWKSGPIYCSEETANLIIHMLAVDSRWIHPLPLDTPTIIPNTGGVSVTLVEANHCPGSCIFFFEGQQTIDAGDSAFKSPFVGSSRTFRYLHCGDFRASPRHVLHPAMNGKHIDHIYLDTTYLDPKYTFSPQPLVISACAELARRLVIGRGGDDPNARTNQNLTIDAWMKLSTSAESGRQQTLQDRVLVIVGTYSIGKERIVKGGGGHILSSEARLKRLRSQAIAQALGTKIYCDPRKTAIIRCQADRELHALLTANPVEANVHLLPLGMVTSDNLKLYLQRFKGTFSRLIGFRPTGWTYSPPSGSDLSSGSIQSIISRGQSRHFSFTDLQSSQKSSYNIQIFGVPYSEHSSFFELTCFAMSCSWGRMIPTVNVGSPTSRAKMIKWLKRWESEKKSTRGSVIPPRTLDYW